MAGGAEKATGGLEGGPHGPGLTSETPYLSMQLRHLVSSFYSVASSFSFRSIFHLVSLERRQISSIY